MKSSKTVLHTLLALVLNTLLSSPAFASGGVKNGGISVRCVDDSKTVMLDSYEAKEDGVRFLEVGRYSRKKMIELISARLSERPEFRNEVLARFKDNRASRFWEPSPDQTVRTMDAFLKKPLRPGCALEQVAYFDSDHPYLLQENYQHLKDSTEVRVLELHEAIYPVAFNHGNTNPALTRGLVAHILSVTENKALANREVDEILKYKSNFIERSSFFLRTGSSTPLGTPIFTSLDQSCPKVVALIPVNSVQNQALLIYSTPNSPEWTTSLRIFRNVSVPFFLPKNLHITNFSYRGNISLQAKVEDASGMTLESRSANFETVNCFYQNAKQQIQPTTRNIREIYDSLVQEFGGDGT